MSLPTHRKNETFSNSMETKIALFKGKEIRKTIYNNEWWFVVEEVVFVLTVSKDPNNIYRD